MLRKRVVKKKTRKKTTFLTSSFRFLYDLLLLSIHPMSLILTSLLHLPYRKWKLKLLAGKRENFVKRFVLKQSLIYHSGAKFRNKSVFVRVPFKKLVTSWANICDAKERKGTTFIVVFDNNIVKTDEHEVSL